jgi:hypothetical protein
MRGLMPFFKNFWNTAMMSFAESSFMSSFCHPLIDAQLTIQYDLTHRVSKYIDRWMIPGVLIDAQRPLIFLSIDQP